MCQIDATRRSGWLVALALAGLGAALAQPTPSASGALKPDWRRIGNSSFDAYLAAAATGPVDRVWFSGDGARLFIRAASGRIFESENLESWKARPELAVPVDSSLLSQTAPTLPEARAKVRGEYAFGRDLYRSDDGGLHWRNLTSFQGRSIIGEGFLDVAISPAEPDVVVAVNGYGVWRSADGGLSWSGLNDALPNLPIRRVLATPSGVQGTRVLLDDGHAFEWAPGEKQSWRPITDPVAVWPEAARRLASFQLGVEITAVALGSEYSYAGAADGRLWVSLDQGRSWRFSRLGDGAPVAAIYAAPEQPRTVLAALGERPEAGYFARVLRSLDGGLTWEDLTGDLPAGAAVGITADRSGAAVYVATDRGVFFSTAGSAEWIPMSGSLPPGRARDVRLDDAGNQLYVAVDGYGVYSAPAPHRFWNLSVVNSADFSRRPAAPGSLLTVLGGRILRAQAGLLDVPVLAASEGESQIQVPFEVNGSSTQLALELARGRFVFNVPLQEVSPAIFVDHDGSALLLDTTSGVLLDGLTPAHAGARVQILATGLGRVRPFWPTGVVAPLQGPPAVIAKVGAFLDRAPVEVTRATLAPGYIGFYLVEVQLPALVNAGPAELHLEVDGQASNRVRIDLEP